MDHVDVRSYELTFLHADCVSVGSCNLISKMMLGVTNAHRNDRPMSVGAAAEWALGT